MTDLPLNKHDRDDRWLDIGKEPVREMTVEQITELLRNYYAKSNAITFTQCARDVALALAKLGTMRIKE